MVKIVSSFFKIFLFINSQISIINYFLEVNKKTAISRTVIPLNSSLSLLLPLAFPFPLAFPSSPLDFLTNSLIIFLLRGGGGERQFFTPLVRISALHTNESKVSARLVVTKGRPGRGREEIGHTDAPKR